MTDEKTREAVKQLLEGKDIKELNEQGGSFYCVTIEVEDRNPASALVKKVVTANSAREAVAKAFKVEGFGQSEFYDQWAAEDIADGVAASGFLRDFGAYVAAESPDRAWEVLEQALGEHGPVSWEW